MKHKKWKKNRDGKRERVRDNARGWKRVKVFIIVRVISHREIRGGDNGDGAERLREVIRLAVTIIDHRRVILIGICQKVMDVKTRKKKSKRIREEMRPKLRNCRVKRVEKKKKRNNKDEKKT